MRATSNAPRTSRSARRARRSYVARRRLGRGAALLCVLGAALLVPSLFFVDVGGASGSVTVSPAIGLTDGANVTVSWTGRTPNGSPIIEQCNAAPTNPATDCDFLTLVVSETNSTGAGSDTFTVFGGLGPSRSFACDIQNACTIRVADDPADVSTGAQAPITFSTTATTTSSSSSTSSTSGATTSSSSSTSSTSSTSTTSSPDGSTTTTTPGDSTTTTSDPTSVLGTDTSNSGSGGSGGSGDGLVLAFTGTALHLPYTLVAGALFFIVGLGLRRFALADI
ncbi:MAG: neocarzinostatin apoprotein domain-containing protein [Acidimicrobiia bacterium]